MRGILFWIRTIFIRMPKIKNKKMPSPSHDHGQMTMNIIVVGLMIVLFFLISNLTSTVDQQSQELNAMRQARIVSGQ